MSDVYGLVLAAGSGTRMGGRVNKQLLDLAGLPLVAHSIKALLKVPVAGVVLAVAPGKESRFRQLLAGLPGAGAVELTPGGATRGESVRRGLEALPTRAGWVAVHDGARPLVRPEDIRKAVQEAMHWGASTLAVPVKDTIKAADGRQLVRETLPREMLWQVQTPQVFACALLREAHRAALAAGFEGTDDASLVERLGHPVKLVLGQYSNIKITTPEDLPLAEMFFRQQMNFAGELSEV